MLEPATLTIGDVGALRDVIYRRYTPLAGARGVNSMDALVPPPVACVRSGPRRWPLPRRRGAGPSCAEAGSRQGRGAGERYRRYPPVRATRQVKRHALCSRRRPSDRGRGHGGQREAMGWSDRNRQLAAAIDRDIAAGRAITVAGVKVVRQGRDRIAFAWPAEHDIPKIEELQRLVAVVHDVKSTSLWDVALSTVTAGRRAPSGSARLAIALSRRTSTIGSAVLVFHLPDHCEALAAM